MHAAQRPYLPHGTSWCVSQQPCLQGLSDCLLDTCMDGVTAPDQFPGLLSLRNKHQGYCVASHNHCWERSPAKRQGLAMLPIRWLCPNGKWGQLAAFSLSLLYHGLLWCSFCNFCSLPLCMGCCWSCFRGISGAGTHRGDLRKRLTGGNSRILLPTLTILHTGPSLTTAAKV